MIEKVRSDVGISFQSVGVVWQKERFEIFNLDGMTVRTRTMQCEERVQLDWMEMRC